MYSLCEGRPLASNSYLGRYSSRRLLVDSGRNALPRSRGSLSESRRLLGKGVVDRLYRDEPSFLDDPLLTIAYAVSEQPINVLGPTFWILLAYLFLVDEFGH